MTKAPLFDVEQALVASDRRALMSPCRGQNKPPLQRATCKQVVGRGDVTPAAMLACA